MDSERHRDWWRNAVVYQIYPRSFADSTATASATWAESSGSLPRRPRRRRDLAHPFYPSPLADGGYDIGDYRDVDPRLGTLADFDNLVHDAHALGIKVLVDIVPNHTSDQHPWFRAALAADPGRRTRPVHLPAGAAQDGEEPPADWKSHFGGSAWETPPRRQWYCHLFAREQPDLNWANADVRQYFIEPSGSGPTAESTGSASTSPTRSPRTSHPCAASRTWTSACPSTAPTPCTTAKRFTTSTGNGGRSSTTTTPPDGRGRNLAPHQQPHLPLRPAHRTRPGLRLLPAQERLGPGPIRPSHRAVHQGPPGRGGGLTWVLSNHDIPRHSSRLALAHQRPTRLLAPPATAPHPPSTPNKLADVPAPPP